MEDLERPLGHWASLVAQLVKNPPAIQKTLVQFLDWEDPLEQGQALPTPVFLGFHGGLASKESACNAGDLGLIPGLGRSPGEGNGIPTPVFLFGEFQNRGVWWATVHEVAKSWT